MKKRFAQDGLLRNSLYLVSSNLTMGVLGFAFWIVGARLYTPHQVGLAAALIAGAGILYSVGLFGMDITFIRFLPSSRAPDSDISSGLFVVFVATALAAWGYLLLVPSLVPELGFVRQSLGLSLGFIVMTSFAAVNLVTDSVFIAHRKAQYNLLIDGVIQGLTKLVLPFLLIGLGAYGMYAASGLAATVAMATSIIFMVGAFDYRPRVVVSFHFVGEAWRFSAANYASSLLMLVPSFALPLIVVNARGASQAAYYFLTFQFANLLAAAVYALSTSFLAEGSQEGAELPALTRRAGKLVALVSLLGGLVVAASGHWVLLVFGSSYSQQGTAPLMVFAAGTPAVGLYYWGISVLRIKKQLRALILVNAAYATVTLGLAITFAPRGLAWVAGAWLCGNICAGVVGAAAVRRRTKTTRPSGRYGTETGGLS